MTSFSDALFSYLNNLIDDNVTIVQSLPIPDTIPYPIIAWEGLTTSVNDNTSTDKDHIITQDFFVFTEARNTRTKGFINKSEIETLAVNLYELLDDYIGYDFNNYKITQAIAQFPTISPADDTVHSRVISVTFRIEERKDNG